ncbi:MAG: hypothetical protein KC457_08160, partial [Myxococcales bacterium]|nr:hypothetical protein [Myxococcales bacterium]
MDIEWAIDGAGRLQLLQARPLTASPPAELTTCTVEVEAGATPLVSGFPITREAISGRVAHYRRDELADGDIVVSADLEPDLLPALGRAAGVVIEHGGPTSHMAILLRELRMPALIGAAGACERLRSGEIVTLECGGVQGRVWSGILPIQRQSVAIDALPHTRTRVHVVTSAREQLQIYRRLPLAGIGLVRLERVIQERVGVHP